MRKMFCGGLLLCGLVGGAPAQAYYCSEPSEPSCLTLKFGEWDQNDFMLCRHEVESYVEDLAQWQECITREANQRADAAVRRFNCYAEGSDFCP